jgi:hypothetical protein
MSNPRRRPGACVNTLLTIVPRRSIATRRPLVELSPAVPDRFANKKGRRHFWVNVLPRDQ